MIVHGKFAADTLIVDGFDFAQGTPEDIRKFKEFAGRLGLEVWFSASLKGDDPLFDATGIPLGLEDYLDAVDVLISLRHEGRDRPARPRQGPRPGEAGQAPPPARPEDAPHRQEVTVGIFCD